MLGSKGPGSGSAVTDSRQVPPPKVCGLHASIFFFCACHSAGARRFILKIAAAIVGCYYVYVRVQEAILTALVNSCSASTRLRRLKILGIRVGLRDIS